MWTAAFPASRFVNLASRETEVGQIEPGFYFRGIFLSGSFTFKHAGAKTLSKIFQKVK